jgi:hypothetical protein
LKTPALVVTWNIKTMKNNKSSKITSTWRALRKPVTPTMAVKEARMKTMRTREVKKAPKTRTKRSKMATAPLSARSHGASRRSSR